MEIASDGTPRPLSFEIGAAGRTGAGGSQLMSWTSIPVAANLLWKPDSIVLTIPSARIGRRDAIEFEDEQGLLLLLEPAHGLARSLRPMQLTSIAVAEPRLVAQLWDNWPSRVSHRGESRRRLGSAPILLPRPDAAQALFARLRARVEAAAADPETHCHYLDRDSQDEDAIT